MGAKAKPVRQHHYQSAIMDSARWDRFEPRDGDIVITTSYKAGTTWMQGICAALVFQAPQPPRPQDELSPWLDANFAPIEDVVAQLDALEHRRYIKTHCPLDGVRYFDNVNYIFVGRDGRDVFMSMWNHWNNMTAEGIDRLNDAPDRRGPTLPYPPAAIGPAFDEWLERSSFPWEQDGYPFWSHLHHAQTWWDYRHLENLLFVHFADLLADPDREMRRVAGFLGIPVDEAVWPQLVDGVSFARMKSNAEVMAPGASQGMWKDTSNFFHRGTNSRWRGVLTDAQIQRYEAIADERLDPELARWLASGSRTR
jgi:aryl sulfotransferase